MNIVLGILTIVLVLVSLFLTLVILMQRAKSDGGMGGIAGGGMAEATFGADTTNVLSKATINASIVFFILGLGLFLGRIYQHTHRTSAGALPSIAAPASAPLLPPVQFPTAPAPSAAAKAPVAAPAAPSAASAQKH